MAWLSHVIFMKCDQRKSGDIWRERQTDWRREVDASALPWQRIVIIYSVCAIKSWVILNETSFRRVSVSLSTPLGWCINDPYGGIWNTSRANRFSMLHISQRREKKHMRGRTTRWNGNHDGEDGAGQGEGPKGPNADTPPQWPQLPHTHTRTCMSAVMWRSVSDWLYDIVQRSRTVGSCASPCDTTPTAIWRRRLQASVVVPFIRSLCLPRTLSLSVLSLCLG